MTMQFTRLQPSASTNTGAMVASRNGWRGTLLVVRGEQGLASYTASASPMFAAQVATATGSKVQTVDGFPPLVCDRVSRLHATGGFLDGAPATTDKVAETLAAILPPDGWIAAGVRSMRPREVGWLASWRAWYRTTLGVLAPPQRADEVAVTLVGGGGDGAASLVDQVAGLLRLTVQADTWWPLPRQLFNIPALLAGLATLFGGTIGWPVVCGWWPKLAGLAHGRLALNIVGAACLLFAILVSQGALRLGKDAWIRQVTSGRVRVRFGRLLSPHYHGVNKDGEPYNRWVYPLSQAVVPVRLPDLLGVFAPSASGGVEAARQVETPPQLLARCGPLLGSVDGAPVFVPQQDRSEGLMTSGMPQRGKTMVLQDVLAFDMVDKLSPQNLPGCVGADNMIVVFDAKGGTGVDETLQVIGGASQTAGVGAAAMTVEVPDPGTPRIDMFPREGTAAQRAGEFVSLMKSAMGAGAIEYRSENTLTQLFTAALTVTPTMLGEAGLPETLGAIQVANVLATSQGDDVARRLAGVIADHHNDNTDTGLAAAGLQQLFGMPSPDSRAAVQTREHLLDAPRSKIAALLAIPGWWDQGRPAFTWDDAIAGMWTVIIGVGASRSGVSVPQHEGDILASMLVGALRLEMLRRCRGWKAQNKAVSLFCDELALLVGDGDGDDVVWWRNQGREFGLRYAVATQQIQLLPERARQAVLSSGTMLWYQHSDPAGLQFAQQDLSAGGEGWTSADVANLPPFVGLLRTHVGMRRLPPIPVDILGRQDRGQLAPCQQSGSVLAGA